LFRPMAAAIIQVVMTMAAKHSVQGRRVKADVTHPKVIVAAIDGSDLSSRVLATAVAMAPVFGASTEAVHVVETGRGAARARQSAAEAGIVLRVLTGPVLKTLLARVTLPDVALIVAGASTGCAADRALGRHALALIVAARRPMIVVPAAAEVHSALHRMLIPLDASSITAAALHEAVELARAADIDLIALHVHGYHALPMFNDQPQHEVPAWSAEFLRRYWPGPAPFPTLQHRVGVPASEIVRAVEETGADLLVLAWSQNLSPGRARVVERALHESTTPVLLLPDRSPLATIGDVELRGHAHLEAATATA
jgi:nucleotide-binding universal stress UspA family protein